MRFNICTCISKDRPPEGSTDNKMCRFFQLAKHHRHRLSKKTVMRTHEKRQMNERNVVPRPGSSSCTQTPGICLWKCGSTCWWAVWRSNLSSDCKAEARKTTLDCGGNSSAVFLICMQKVCVEMRHVCGKKKKKKRSAHYTELVMSESHENTPWSYFNPKSKECMRSINVKSLLLKPDFIVFIFSIVWFLVNYSESN